METLTKKELFELKKKARQRTSQENEKLNPLNEDLKELGYSLEEAYNLGFEDCEIIYSRKILRYGNIDY